MLPVPTLRVAPPSDHGLLPAAAMPSARCGDKRMVG